MKRKPTPPPRPEPGAVRHTKSEMRKSSLRLHVTATRAIKWKCRNCTNNQRLEIKDCRILTCALWPLRPFAKVAPKDLQHWEEKFTSDPLNKEILGESQMDKLEEIDKITFE